MSDCDDLDFVIASDVDQAERESWEDVALCTTPVAGPRVGILGDGFDRVSQLVAKAMCCGWILRGVPVISRLRLLRGCRMESDSGARHSATVQPRSQLVPGE